DYYYCSSRTRSTFIF
nr:immunoglobulin light chain junction region [Macaca mulatta]